MRTLIIIIALIAGFYSGWREQQKGDVRSAAIERSDCASEIGSDVVATWAADAAARAFNFKVGEAAEATADRSLFSGNGWNGMLAAGRKAGMLSKNGLNANYGVDHIGLQVTGVVDAQQIDVGSNGFANAWRVSVPVVVGPPEAHLAGPAKLELLVSCDASRPGAPLAIDQWIMVPAN